MHFFSEGVVEIWLTSEDLGAYGHDIGVTLPELLWQLVEVIPEGARMRLGMTNPPYILEHLEVQFVNETCKTEKLGDDSLIWSMLCTLVISRKDIYLSINFAVDIIDCIVIAISMLKRMCHSLPLITLPGNCQDLESSKSVRISPCSCTVSLRQCAHGHAERILLQWF